MSTSISNSTIMSGKGKKAISTTTSKKPAAVAVAAAVEAHAPAPAPVPAPAAPAPAPSAIPVASAVETPVAATPIPTFAEQITCIMSELTTIRNAVSTAITSVKNLEKRHNREVKDARKRRKRNTKSTESADGEDQSATPAAIARPSIFTTPIPLNDNLATLLNKMKGTMVCPSDLTHLVSTYISEHNLKGEKGIINPDEALCSAFGLERGEPTNHRQIQKKLYDIIKGIITKP
jgi:hypothetical protein